MDIYNPVPITDSVAIKALQTKVTSLNTQVTALQAVDTANATLINTANLSVSGMSKVATGFVNPAYGQGAYMAWNRTPGDGMTSFINSRGAGPGGFNWFNYDDANASVGLMNLSATGVLTCGSVTSTFTGNLTGNASTVTTNANLTGEVTSVGNTTTMGTAAVTGKLLSGYSATSGTLAATDSILGAFQKIGSTVQTLGGLATGTIPVSSLVTLTGTQTLTNKTITGTLIGNASTVTTNANLTGEVTSVGNATTLSNAAVIGKVLTGLAATAGTVSATDTILTAIGKNSGTLNNATAAATANTLMLRDGTGSTTAGTLTCTTLTVAGSSKLSTTFTTPTEQGTFSGWNRVNGTGTSSIINQRGAGVGGFEWLQYSNSNVLTGVLMTLTNAGALACASITNTSQTTTNLTCTTLAASTITGNSITLASTGGTPSALDFYATQSFATTFTGPYTTATITFRLTRIGNVVTMTTIGGSTGISTVDTSFASSTAIPLAYRSTVGAPLNIIRIYNGSSNSEAGYVSIGSTGFMNISPLPNVNFAASGLVGFDNFTCTYVIS